MEPFDKQDVHGDIRGGGDVQEIKRRFGISQRRENPVRDIVEKYEGGRVYTIEGNSSDQVRQRNYAVDYSSIMGYGLIN